MESAEIRFMNLDPEPDLDNANEGNMLLFVMGTCFFGMFLFF